MSCGRTGCGRTDIINSWETCFPSHIRILSRRIKCGYGIENAFRAMRIWLGMARKAFYIPYPHFIPKDKMRIWLGMARNAFYISYLHFILWDKMRIWLGKHVSQEFIIFIRPSATHPSVRAQLIRPSVSAFYPNPAKHFVRSVKPWQFHCPNMTWGVAKRTFRNAKHLNANGSNDLKSEYAGRIKKIEPLYILNENAYHRRKHGSRRHEPLKDNLSELNCI